MRVIDLPIFWTILLDCLAWAVFQPGVATLAMMIPIERLNPLSPYFCTRPWERGGQVYQSLFAVRRWKSKVPSAANFFGSRGFKLDRVESFEMAYLERWCRESCRAELCHWAAILPAVLFFLWNPLWVGWFMVAYALAFNLPIIIIQRHNRPKVLRILQEKYPAWSIR